MVKSFSACSDVSLIPLQGIAQINLADYDSLSEMQLRWHSVQVFTSSEPSRTREPGCAGESSARDPAHTISISGKTVLGLL